MVRTDKLWLYTNTIQLAHCHTGDVLDGVTWSTLTKVTDSEAQGWDLHLECGCKLQSCFADTEWDVNVLWSDEVLNWCKI